MKPIYCNIKPDSTCSFPISHNQTLAQMADVCPFASSTLTFTRGSGQGLVCLYRAQSPHFAPGGDGPVRFGIEPSLRLTPVCHHMPRGYDSTRSPDWTFPAFRQISPDWLMSPRLLLRQSPAVCKNAFLTGWFQQSLRAPPPFFF